MRRLIVFLVLITVAKTVFGQVDYRLMRQYELSNDYWKAHLPEPGYWQQDAHYAIKAKLDHKNFRIVANEELVYVNNSPDTLNEVYFHLYQNAFQPNSYYHKLFKNDGRKVFFSYTERKGLGTVVDSIQSLSGIDSVYIDNTIMYVRLKRSIFPGQKTTFKVGFSSYFGFGSMRRRMKAYPVEGGNWHFNLAHWYPRICVYDNKFGWNTNQHLDKEFYGEFGTFDVQLTLPEDYIVEGTGYLANRREVLPDDLRAQLDVKNFLHRGDKSEADTLSEIIPYNSKLTKTWHFKASNVHDVAFVADPTFRLDEGVYNGSSIIAVVEERHVPSWKTAVEFTKQVVQTYSEDFYPYPYPKIVVADAEDGMEYPMITMNTGGEPGYRDLLAHEVGHNWFQGMVGSNETYRAMMDEGFTQFLTMWSLIKIDGDTSAHKPYGKEYYKRFKNQSLTVDRRIFNGYCYSVLHDNDARLNTHSSEFGCGIRHADGYGHVYYKTAAMLLSLQNILGDTLFLNTMHSYIEKYRFAHPYPEDFRLHVIRYTKRDLNWFFDQWIESTEVLDYSVKSVKRKRGVNDTYTITIRRKGDMEMPLDLKVETFEDTVYYFHIPNDYQTKTTNAKVLPKWEGLGEVQREYSFDVVIPEGLYNVIIDPEHMLADVNLLNNSKVVPVKIEWNDYLKENPSRYEYVLKVAPKLWYNGYDGLKFGLNFDGDYYKTLHKIDATLWMNTGLFQSVTAVEKSTHAFDDFNMNLEYATPLRSFGKGQAVSFRQSFYTGIYHSKGTWKYEKNKKSFEFASILYTSYNNSMVNYQFSELHWNARRPNHSIKVSYSQSYKGNGYFGKLNLDFRTSAFSFYDYSYFDIDGKYLKRMGRGVIRTRGFLRIGRGANWAPESQLYLAGANPEEMYESLVYQTYGLIGEEDMGYGPTTKNVHMGGGLNLRGYVGYLAPEVIDGTTLNGFRGNSGAAINLEYDFSKYLWKKNRSKYFSWETYLFADAGLLNYSSNDFQLGSVRSDAGIGYLLNVKKYWLFQTMKPTVIRVDFPFWLSRIPAVENNHWDFRWLIGLKRTF